MAHALLEDDITPVVNNDDDVPLISIVSAPTRLSKIWKTLRKVTIEPFMFLYIIGIKLPDIPVENLLIYKVCRYKEFNTTICSNLLQNKLYFLDKIIVQESLADWKIYIEIMQALPMLFLAIVVGPWSDKFGRKLPLLIPILGRIASHIGVLLNFYFIELSVVYLILSFLPSALLGSNIVTIISFSYISDISRPKSRTIRLAVMSFLVNLGEPIGLIIGTKVSETYGLYPIMTAALICLFLALIFGALTIKETIFSTAPTSQKIKEFFKISIMKECFQTFNKARQGRKRIYLWCYLIAINVFVLYRVADWKVSYMFTQVKFDWAGGQFTIFTVIKMTLGSLILIVLAPILSKFYRVKDHTFVIIGIISAIVCYLIYGLCSSAQMFYLGAIIGSFMGLVYLGIMSAVSKSAEPDEQGKLYAVILTTSDVIVPVIGTVIQLKIYKHTLEFYPGFVYCLNSALLLIPLALVLWMKKDGQRKMVPSSTQTDSL